MKKSEDSAADMEYVDDFKERIFEQYERLSLDSEFTFDCGMSMKCFTACCGDVNIFLTPYDIIRMRRRLGIDSQKFLEKYTMNPFTRTQKLPSVLFRMNDETKRCQFVTEEGCSIYEDRPWACRMYPIGKASPRDEGPKIAKVSDFYFLMAEDECLGVKEGKRKFTVRDWIKDQGIADYDRMGDLFKKVCLHPMLEEINLTPQKMDMFYMASYNVDAFRRFIRDSRFRHVYEFTDEKIEEITSTDERMFEFAMDWLLFSLFNEKTIKIRDEVIASKKKAMALD